MTPEPALLEIALLGIKLRLMQTMAPYVGVDFGEGRNAVFDLTTMLCTYSD